MFLLPRGTEYYWDIPAGTVTDDRGGSSPKADASSNQKIVFSTTACPNSVPYAVTSYPSTPANNASNVSTSVSSVNILFVDDDNDSLSHSSGSAKLKNLRIIQLYLLGQVFPRPITI